MGLAALAVASAQAAEVTCGASFSAVYELEFVATWSAESHPQDFPYDNPHFTGPVGGTHNADYAATCLILAASHPD